MTIDSPFVFDTEDNFDDSYANQQENDSIYEGKKELYILEVNESMHFKNFYFNIEDRYEKEEEDKDKDDNEEGFSILGMIERVSKERKRTKSVVVN